MGNIAAPPAKSVDRTILVACVAYASLPVVFWFVARHFDLEVRIQGHMASSFTAFALLLAPYWFFGFGAAEMLRRRLTNRVVRVLIAGLLLVGRRGAKRGFGRPLWFAKHPTIWDKKDTTGTEVVNQHPPSPWFSVAEGLDVLRGDKSMANKASKTVEIDVDQFQHVKEYSNITGVPMESAVREALSDFIWMLY
jgi:hypothetical protein